MVEVFGVELGRGEEFVFDHDIAVVGVDAGAHGVLRGGFGWGGGGGRTVPWADLC